MTDYPFEITERTPEAMRSITIASPTGVPEVDAQIDLLGAVQAKQRLAIEREHRAADAVRDARNASDLRLAESMSSVTDDLPDFSGDAEVTKAELTHEAAKRITQAANAAVTTEVGNFFAAVGEHRAEVRQALWKKVEKARETLSGAAMAAERAFEQLQVSAAMVAGLDRLPPGVTWGRFGPAPYSGGVEASIAVAATKDALVALNGWMESAYEPAPKKPAEVESDPEFD
jgi:hypothetical protein